MKTALVWFRSDLRLADNDALAEACWTHEAVVPVYLWAPGEEGRWRPGAASCWWLHHSLASLSGRLRNLGSALILRRGADSFDMLRELIRETGARTIFWNRLYQSGSRDAEIEKRLSQEGIEVQTFNGSLLIEPGALLNSTKLPFQVFSPFWQALRKSFVQGALRDSPAAVPSPPQFPESEDIAAFELLPKIPWDAGFYEVWKPGEDGAHAALKSMLQEKIARYENERDRPDLDGTSRLSPYLHFGQISVRRVWHEIRGASKQLKVPASSAEAFLRELGWREFAYHILFHYPRLSDKPLREKFASFPWRRNTKRLDLWQQGKTGYPIVDAGMRQLWRTGWMHNRVRMVTASFLVKDLLIPWQDGAKWFWNTLVDADLANNTMGWQWTAGCGPDAAPYFRVFHPVIQGEKFDPEGDYVRKWLPELARMPKRWIHQPWEAPPDVLREAGVKLGDTYPRPIVDHAEAREKALDAFAELEG